MKKSVLCIFLAGVLAFAGSVGAQGGVKIGVVNANLVVEKSPQYDEVRKSLETEFKRRNQDLISQQKQLKTLEEKLSRDGTVMSASEVKRLEQDIRSHRRKINHTRDEYREDLNLRRNEEVNKLLRKVSEVVKQVGQEEDMDVILSDGVVYVNQRVDITEKVLQRLQELYKSSGK